MFILILIAILIIVVLIVCNHNKHEKFSSQNEPCYSYYERQNYPQLDANSQNALDDMQVGSWKNLSDNINSKNLNPGQQIDGCVITTDLFPRYKLDSQCILQDVDQKNTNKFNLTPVSDSDLLNPSGCLVRFSDYDNSGQPYYDPNSANGLPELLKVAFSNKDSDNRTAIETINNTLVSTKQTRDAHRTELDTTIKELQDSQSLNNQLISNKDVANNRLNSSQSTLTDLTNKVSAHLGLQSIMSSGYNTEKSSKIYSLVNSPITKFQKIFFENGLGVKYDVLWKYNTNDAINRNIDPHNFWTGSLSQYRNENAAITDPNLIWNSTNNISYRNDALITSIFSSQNTFFFVVEVYNHNGDHPICWMKFRFIPGQTTISNWFNRNFLINTNIDGLMAAKSTCQFFDTTNGDDRWARRFFINQYYCGCLCDYSWFCIPFGTTCDWDTRYHGHIITTKTGMIPFGSPDSGFINNVNNYYLGTTMIIYAMQA